MKLITILSNAGGLLVAEQKPQSGGNTIFILIFVGLLAYFIYLRAWKLLALPIGGLIFLLWLTTGATKPTYRISIDQQHRTITSDGIKDGKQISHVVIPAQDLNSAEMQFNRGASRIVLIHRDGQQTFPLGEQHVQDEPDQYVVLNALRETIGQVPVAPK